MADSIAVLGSGVVGLTTALDLRARGAGVVVYSDPVAHPPASAAAPALFTPYSAGDEAQFRRRTEHAFAVLSGLASDHPECGVSIGPVHDYRASPAVPRPWLDALLQGRPLAAHPPYAEASATIRPHLDMLRYLPWLEGRARAQGVEFVTRSVRAFDELFALGHAVVVNCAGAGAQRLAGDGLVKPVHGQVLHAPNDIGLDRSVEDDAPGGRVTYVFVFGERLVLGGTFEAGREDQNTDRAALDAIIDRCRNLLRLDGVLRWEGLAKREIRALAGVRPARGRGGCMEQVRVEREERAGGRAVVHHYGHGRAGVSLSWATAAEAADLAAP